MRRILRPRLVGSSRNRAYGVKSVVHDMRAVLESLLALGLRLRTGPLFRGAVLLLGAQWYCRQDVSCSTRKSMEEEGAEREGSSQLHEDNLKRFGGCSDSLLNLGVASPLLCIRVEFRSSGLSSFHELAPGLEQVEVITTSMREPS